ncbi:alpha/beta hydrolase [Prauserella marina]|uniref:alpha/beta fold hydrolase n=1 Tax=Prauserella marina TaxID=530584 RepID=UPI000B8D78F8|nr:alpha/beta hydrolase [Prauserella marina]ASR39225.1 alpha/beta hydrolase [Prauserella marina]
MTGIERPTALAKLSEGVVEYRHERRDGPAVLIFHGGHMRAGIALGEEVFADAGNSVLVPSRPGYGRTPLETGTSPDGFADVARSLCERLGITRVAAVVGISAGGRTAMAMAARHPGLVERVILMSAVGPLPWPSRAVRIAGRIVFAPGSERLTWSVMRAILRGAPETGLRLLLGDLSTLSARTVLSAVRDDHRETLIGLFASMRSGRGFLNDLTGTPVRVGERLTQPGLIIASRHDGAVGFAHAEVIADAIPHGRLVESAAPGHLIWFADDWPAISGTVRDFLAT